ncbi:hypothetical protein BK120_30150 [Paenibacillus sp. FSL A5-0031]|uniref:hypothetical protein n=1 Tax=Paenibacillus sp. FSL A5-0031 TaxID=1920420 RepID=UPI00096F715B|nr:hypothetical protein [Paenibacillus sp. FSL A5-0031]OME75929.1 hypothetical protein BK120_30150 [Paenibacillus sp. FSL A5-0031]
MITKKILVGLISSFVITALFSILASSPKSLILSNIPWLFMYIAPCVLLYGIPASIVSDNLGKKTKYPILASLLLHVLSASLFIVFSVSFMLISIGSSILFFSIGVTLDFLRKKTPIL